MRNTTILVLLAIIIVVVGGFVFAKSGKNGNNGITGNVVKGDFNNDGNVQKIILSEKDFNYYPPEIKVKANQPVSISLDNEVFGCLRALTIRELGLSKYLKGIGDSLDFTPTKKGVYTISCSMGMGFGKLIVE